MDGRYVQVIHVPLWMAREVERTVLGIWGGAYLDVTPPVRTYRPGAFREIDLFLWVKGVEFILIANTSGVTVKRNTSKCVASLFHLG